MTSQSDPSHSPHFLRGKVTILVGAIILLVFLMPAILRRQGGASLGAIRQRGVLRVGYAVEAPYAFNRSDGAITGESPEVVKYVSRKLNFPRIEWIQTTFDQLIPQLEADRFDVIASGLFITPERSERVLFSKPTFEAKTGLLVPIGNPQRLNTVEDVSQAQWIQIAVIGGAVEAQTLKAAGVAESQLIIVPDAATGRAAVQSGSVAGLALSAATVRRLVAENPGEFDAVIPFESRSLKPVRQFGGLAFQKNATELRDAFDAVLDGFVGTPQHLEIVGPFGFSAGDVSFGTSASAIPP